MPAWKVPTGDYTSPGGKVGSVEVGHKCSGNGKIRQADIFLSFRVAEAYRSNAH